MILWKVSVWVNHRFVKLYGWKETLRYYIMLPRFILWGLEGIARREHIINEMSKRDFLSLAMACCDAVAGRRYRWDDVYDWVTIVHNIRFDYYDARSCRKYIMENYSKIAKIVEGETWIVEVETWE